MAHASSDSSLWGPITSTHKGQSSTGESSKQGCVLASMACSRGGTPTAQLLSGLHMCISTGFPGSTDWPALSEGCVVDSLSNWENQSLDLKTLMEGEEKRWYIFFCKMSSMLYSYILASLPFIYYVHMYIFMCLFIYFYLLMGRKSGWKLFPVKPQTLWEKGYHSVCPPSHLHPSQSSKILDVKDQNLFTLLFSHVWRWAHGLRCWHSHSRKKSRRKMKKLGEGYRYATR